MAHLPLEERGNKLELELCQAQVWLRVKVELKSTQFLIDWI